MDLRPEVGCPVGACERSGREKREEESEVLDLGA